MFTCTNNYIQIKGGFIMKRRNQIVTIYIPDETGSSQGISFNISLSALQKSLKEAIKNDCNVITFRVKNRNVDIEIEKVKQIIRVAKKQIDSRINIPRNLRNYISVLSNLSNKKLSARDEEIEKLWTCLCSKQKSNAILVGEHGVGKTTMAMEIVRQISLNECPKQFTGYNVFQINTMELLELAKHSMFLYKYILNCLLEFIETNRNSSILYIDNLIHIKYDVDLMKCFLLLVKKSNAKIIGSVSFEDFEKYFIDEISSMKYLNPILLEEPDLEEIYPILKDQIDLLKKEYKIKISEKMIRFAVLTGYELSSSSSANPESTLDIINFALADAKRKGQKEVLKNNILSYYYIDFKLAKKTSEADKWITAYHEAGHYLVSKMSPNIKNFKNAFVSILPIEGALGLTASYIDFGKQLFFSKEYYIDEIALSLGGRVGEAIYTKEFSSSAQADLESANTMAEQLVLSFGLSSIEGEQNKSYMIGNYIKDFLLTDELRLKINKEISNIINDAYHRAEKIIEENRELFEEIVKRLISDGVLMGDELEEICMKYAEKNLIS